MLCQEAGADREAIADLTARVPRDTVGKLWRAAVLASGDRQLGIHAAEALRREPNHLFEFLLLKGATLGDGLDVAIRYQALVAHGRVVSLELADAVSHLRFHRVEGALPVTPQEIEFLLATTVGYLRVATDDALDLRKVTFAHPYHGGIEEFERFFRCSVYFGEAHNELVLPREALQLPLRVADPDQHRELAEIAEGLHRNVELPTFLNAVSIEIGRLLERGQATVDGVAESLHLSSRTLQRRLHEQGTTFRAVLESRRRMIITEGVESRRNPAEIARRAGFANVRGLVRATRRWKARP